MTDEEIQEPTDDVENFDAAASEATYYKAQLSKKNSENQNLRKRLRSTEEERDSFAARGTKFSSLLNSLGIEDEEGFDPSDFADEYKSVLDGYRRESVSFATFKAAQSHGANYAALSDSSSFQSKTQGLDIGATDFEDQVSSLVREAVESNPYFKTGQVPAVPNKSGAEIPGGASEGLITEAMLSTMTPKDIVDARNEGRLKHLGFGV
jgi:hypothetical protein